MIILILFFILAYADLFINPGFTPGETDQFD